MIDPEEKIRHVELVPPNPNWVMEYEAAAAEIQVVLGDQCIAIHHIGSTAIPGIYAKTIIDILPVVKTLDNIDSFNQQFESFGYVCMGEYGLDGRRYYWRSKRKRSHHIHLFAEGHSEIARHVGFRDFMRVHPDHAEAYSIIKRSLATVFPDDIENYVDGKASFVQWIDYHADFARNHQLIAKDNIIIQTYNPAWPKLAEAEIAAMKAISHAPYVNIEHIGSTAVPMLASKPIIDIFITVKSIHEAQQWVRPLELLGYLYWSENPEQSHLRFFKGMPPYGEKRTHHVHIVEATNDTFDHRILFRDILRSNAHVRQAYEALKLKLSQESSLDRELYTESKWSFIEETLRRHDPSINRSVYNDR